MKPPGVCASTDRLRDLLPTTLGDLASKNLGATVLVDTVAMIVSVLAVPTSRLQYESGLGSVLFESAYGIRLGLLGGDPAGNAKTIV